MKLYTKTKYATIQYIFLITTNVPQVLAKISDYFVSKVYMYSVHFLQYISQNDVNAVIRAAGIRHQI